MSRSAGESLIEGDDGLSAGPDRRPGKHAGIIDDLVAGGAPGVGIVHRVTPAAGAVEAQSQSSSSQSRSAFASRRSRRSWTRAAARWSAVHCDTDITSRARSHTRDPCRSTNVTQSRAGSASRSVSIARAIAVLTYQLSNRVETTK